MNDRRKTTTYDRVLAAAKELLAGDSVPTAQQVAERAGISLSTYYRTVDSHASLLRDAGHVAEPSARDRLLDAARELLDEVGLSNLLMDDIAARAGVSRGTLYRLFPGRTALFEALAESRAPIAALGPILRNFIDHPPDVVLPAIITAATPQMLANRGLIRAVLTESSIEAVGAGPGRAVLTHMFSDVAAYISAQMDAGRLRRMDPMIATIALLGPLHAFTLTRPDFWFGPGATTDPNQIVAELVQVWLRGMQP